MSGSHLSKDFFDLVKAIGESKSKQEEDRIITREVGVLKARMKTSNLSRKLIKESLVRLIYVEMLGHDASFAYVHAIQLTASGDIMQKRVGYLTAALTLSPDHEFRFMLVNQLQRDLSSANLLEVSIALVAVCKLITEEMIPALLPSIQKCISHDSKVVRKKAVMALFRIYQLDPGSIDHLLDQVRRVLCDKDPAVMGASLSLLYELAKADPATSKNLVPSFVSILKQIVEHRLPKDFDYHRIPAPWIQIKLLKILAILGANDQRTSEAMYEVLGECMKRANTGIYVGYAIIYECVRTVTTIYPNPVLLDVAAGAIARFIQSDSHNLKYLGVTGLAAVVRDHPRYAAEHQMVVLDCLEDPDETLKRKTLDLLYRMTNPVNAEVVVEKLIGFLKGAQDKFLRQDLVERICQLAERFAPSNIWYVRTVTKVFELGGDLVKPEITHNLLRLLAEGVGEEGEDGEDEDTELRREACEIFYDMFEKSQIPDNLLRVMFWTLGEYAYLMGVETLPDLLDVICESASAQGMRATTRGYAVSSVMKLCAQLGTLPEAAADLIDKYSSSLDADLQQKCYEFRELARDPATMRVVLPVDASSEDLEDPDFSFLDAYVEQARAEGAPEYSPPVKGESGAFEDDDDEDEDIKKGATGKPKLKFDAYAKPAPPPTSFMTAEPTLSYAGNGASSGGGESGAPKLNGASGTLNMSGVKSVWGSSGYGGTGPGAGVSSVSSVAAAKLEQAAISNAQSPPQASLTPAYMLAATPSPAPKPAQPAAAATPPAPKVLTEREKMAAALFGGVAPDSSPSLSTTSGSSSRPARRRPGQVETPVTAPAAPAPASPVNLLDFGDSSSPSNAASPAAEAPSSEFDLLSLDVTPASAGDLMSSTPAAAPTNSLFDDDLLGGGGGGEGEDSAAPTAMQATPSLPYAAKQINTQEFGSLWGLNSAQSSLTVPMQVSAVGDIVTKVQEKLGLSVVEVILQTQEAIFAGVEHGSGQVVLVHAKKGAIGADLMLRSSSAQITDHLKTTIKAKLAF